MEGTFADFLIQKGFRFHPETVVIEGSTVFEKATKDGKVFLPNSIPCTAPFKHLFIQGAWYGRQTGCYIEVLEFENRQVSLETTPFALDSKRLLISDCVGLFWLENGVAANVEFRGVDMMIRYNNIFGIDANRFEWAMIPDLAQSVCMASVMAIQALHQKALLELIEYPRNYRRRIKRKTGKEPSPYFMLKMKPGQTRKEYEDYERPVRDKGEKSKMPLTLVRGHFRHVENHPIEHFNGTRWIASHTRGHLDNGEIKKGYTIVLE